MAADRLVLSCNRQRAAPPRALERHMLQHMGDAVDLGRLVARAGIDPDPDRHGLDLRHRLGNHAQAVGQRADAPGHAGPRVFPMKLRTAAMSLGSMVWRSRSEEPTSELHSLMR